MEDRIKQCEELRGEFIRNNNLLKDLLKKEILFVDMMGKSYKEDLKFLMKDIKKDFNIWITLSVIASFGAAAGLMQCTTNLKLGIFSFSYNVVLVYLAVKNLRVLKQREKTMKDTYKELEVAHEQMAKNN